MTPHKISAYDLQYLPYPEGASGIVRKWSHGHQFKRGACLNIIIGLFMGIFSPTIAGPSTGNRSCFAWFAQWKRRKGKCEILPENELIIMTNGRKSDWNELLWELPVRFGLLLCGRQRNYAIFWCWAIDGGSSYLSLHECYFVATFTYLWTIFASLFP